MAIYGYIKHSDDCLMHHGVKGQKWGIRRYQNEDGTLTAAGRKRYGVDISYRKKYSDGRTAFGSFDNIVDENAIFNRARRDKFRQYIEDLKNREFLKNYKKTNKAFDDVTTNAILNYRKQYSPEDLFNRQAGRRYLKQWATKAPIYGAYGAAHDVSAFNNDFAAAKWNRDKYNPYKKSHKLIENRLYVYSKKNPILDKGKSEFENRVAYARYLEDQKKKKEKLRSKYYD